MRSPCEKPLALRFAIAPRSSRAIERVDARGERPLGQAVQSPVVLDVLAARELLIEPGAVRQHAERAAGRERRGRDIDAADAGRAGIRFQHRRENAQARRFARAVRPEQPRDPAVAGLEAHALEGPHGAEPFADAVDLDHGAGPSKLTKNGVGGSRSRQLASRSAGIGHVEERAHDSRHAADAGEPVALAAADQVHAVAQAVGLDALRVGGRGDRIVLAGQAAARVCR